MLNGVDELLMMKADVLSPFKNIKVCTSYEFEHKTIEQIPFDSSSGLKPNYMEVKGWDTEITALKDIKNAPDDLVNYVKLIEKLVDTPVSVVSVGPDRTQTLFR